MFLQEVVQRGFEGLFDFLYLPRDFKKGINMGFGFVNFIEPEYALRFRDSLDGQHLDNYMRMKSKAIRVHPAAVQGYDANFRHFAHTKTGQKQDPSFSPIFCPVPQDGQVNQMFEQALGGSQESSSTDGVLPPGQLQQPMQSRGHHASAGNHQQRRQHKQQLQQTLQPAQLDMLGLVRGNGEMPLPQRLPCSGMQQPQEQPSQQARSQKHRNQQRVRKQMPEQMQQLQQSNGFQNVGMLVPASSTAAAAWMPSDARRQGGMPVAPSWGQ
jgi:RNA recognition motif-containing protein